MDNIYVSTKYEYDAIVVGSGISGGWAAKELTELGLNVLMLERGGYVEHGKDYTGEHKAPWDMPLRGRDDRVRYEEEYKTQSKCYAFSKYNESFWVNDKKHPYIEEKPFDWIRGYHLGGRSLMWGRQTYRWSDLDFEANLKDGHGVDWPIRYKDIEPWYDYVERFAGISGQKAGLPHLPDGQFLPPFAMNVVENHISDSIKKNWNDRMMMIGRCANLSVPHKGRAKCHFCGPCHRGCTAGAYFSSLSSTLPAAFATGRLAIRTNSIVHSVIYDEKLDRATGVRIIDSETNEAREYFGKIVFLCASTLGTTQIMLNSKSNRFPNGIGNASGALGKGLMDHHFQVGASGKFPQFNEKYYVGNRPTGIYVPRFRNLSNETNGDYVRGFGYQGDAGRSTWGRGNEIPEVGTELKMALRQPGDWNMWLGAWGEQLPDDDNYVYLDPKQTDRWGIPILRVHAEFKENEKRMRKDMMNSSAEMLEASGAKDITTFDNQDAYPGLCIHEMGTARMGRDPKTSVLNGHNQCHEVPNLFVTDGACMTSNANQNPSITYMALTARASHYAVEMIKKGELKV
jgi:choline dehydrogenase-like flavoprotein